MHLAAECVEIILSNENLTARQISAAMALPARTVEGVRRRYGDRGRGRPRSPWVLGILRRWPTAPTRYVVAASGASPATVRRVRRARKS
jgi:hypothetical protein